MVILGIVYALIAIAFLIPVLVFKPMMLWFAPVAHPDHGECLACPSEIGACAVK